jgi:hypothetical protein
VNETGCHSFEPCELSRHVDSEDIYDIAWRTLTSHWTSSYYLDLARDMSNRHLLARLLNLDILISHEFALFDLNHQLTLHVILTATLSRTFNQRSELFPSHDLVDFETAGITSVNCYLDTWLDSAALGNNSLHSHHRSYSICLYLPHFYELLFRSWYK